MTHDADLAQAVEPLLAPIRQIFGDRLNAFLVYGQTGIERTPDGIRTLALVSGLRYEDLQACAPRIAGWHRAGFATPLILTSDEFSRSLDAFPLEYGAILAHHVLVAGTNPFEGASVDEQDVRRACEVQAKSHLLHLREGYLESGGRPAAVAQLLAASAAPFAALLRHVARLQGVEPDDPKVLREHVEQEIGLPGKVIERILTVRRPDDLPGPEAVSLYPACLEAAERLARYVDEWKR
jgi:hypothetical protein